MALSWNEIKDRALRFSKEWEDESREDAEAKSFLDGFFNVFGVPRRRVATFEERVKNISGKTGYIDLLWKGVLLIEQKSRGQNLEKAYKQATDYFPGIKDYDLPKYILISDFEKFKLYDLDENSEEEFELKDLYKNVKLFGFILGYQKKTYKEEDPVNIKAAELMGKLHDKLKEVGYEGHSLEVYLVRILFCLFADDTTIFDKNLFRDFIEQKTSEDGSDLGAHLANLFHNLNTPKEKRLTNIDESLNQFPYVNGKLFEETLPPASFDSSMRKMLLDCCSLNWGLISPAIFGSMFQSVMNPVERRNIGAHYTSEKNILKLIKPLFLDNLQNEFEKVKSSQNDLSKFHNKIAGMKFLDPACGCGNFLVITYRELRLLEIDTIKVLMKGQQVTDVNNLIKIEVDKFYGIEIDEFPSQIAPVAMWLMDHQMNMRVSEEFGDYFARLPLTKSANIIHGNSLRIDWEKIVPKNELSFILGNPPFIGKQMQNAEQKKDAELILGNIKGAGVLDFVCCWYIKAAEYIQDTNIKVAFVSTNSISQGEQVGILWNELFNKYKIKIHFAHKTFKWNNEAKGNAAVHCVIIGFANYNINEKYLYEYDTVKSEPHEIKVKNINPYLVDANDVLILKRNLPICDVPLMFKGSQPTDGGNFLFTVDEKNEFLTKEPNAKKFIKPLISSHEFLNGKKRYCLWLVDAEPGELNQMPHLLKRIEGVRQMRLKSTKQATIKWANQPTLFTENRQPISDFLLIPRTTSENRRYIPLGFFKKDHIVSDSCNTLPNAKLFHFGILSSLIHMSWVKYVCGRLKSDFRYSNEIVYNNFPWPESPTESQIKSVEDSAKVVLDVRKEFPDSSLADLYDPLTMPPALVKAHQQLDRAVDKCYRSQPFTSESNRIEYLFQLYDKYVSGMFVKEKK